MIGRKLKMSQVYDTHGRVNPVTELLIEPNVVVVLKEKESDGYKAAQIGLGVSKKTTKPLQGHFSKAGLKENPKILREVEFDGDLKSGQEIKIDEVFHKGSLVDVVGKSKGKGFAGVVKRHGFHGGPKTHGQSDRHRAPGSIGSGTTPGRVMKGLKMPGHMGNAQVSVFGLEIMAVDKEKGLLLVKGSVPGPSESLLLIKKSKKKRAAYHEPEIPAQPTVAGDSEEKVAEEVNNQLENGQIEAGKPEEKKSEVSEG